MKTQSLAEERLNHPRSRTAFHSAQLLVGGYLGVSVLTLAAIVLLRNNPRNAQRDVHSTEMACEPAS